MPCWYELTTFDACKLLKILVTLLHLFESNLKKFNFQHVSSITYQYTYLLTHNRFVYVICEMLLTRCFQVEFIEMFAECE